MAMCFFTLHPKEKQIKPSAAVNKNLGMVLHQQGSSTQRGENCVTRTLE